MFSKKLKELRIEKGITQDDLAQIIYVSRSAIAKWEQGRGMPNKESLTSLAKYFGVSESELLNEEDPVLIINNIEKDSKKSKKTIIACFSSAIVILLIVMFCLLFKSNKIKIYDNQFFTDEYLDRFELNSLEMIEGEDYFVAYDGVDEKFMSTIENQETFDKYVEYVYDYLKNSLHISYLSFAYKEFSNDVNKEASKYYLVQSTCLNDHICRTNYHNADLYTSNDVIATSYEFYFITNADKNRKLKDEVISNCLRINSVAYRDKLSRYTKDYNYNFSIELFSRGLEHWGYDVFLANEFFDIEEINITKDNIKTYFHVEEYDSSTNYLNKKFSIATRNEKSKSILFLNIKAKMYMYYPQEPDPEEQYMVKGSADLDIVINDGLYTRDIANVIFGNDPSEETKECQLDFEYNVLEGSKIYNFIKK